MVHAQNSKLLTFDLGLLSALIKSELRRHNVNMGGDRAVSTHTHTYTHPNSGPRAAGSEGGLDIQRGQILQIKSSD